MMDDCYGRALRVAVVFISIVVAGCASSSGEDDPGVRQRLALQEWRKTCAAAVAGDAEAQKWMAEYYRNGYAPVQQDRVKAYLWYEHAERGLPPGNLKRVETGMEMTLDELTEAKRLEATWTPESESCTGEPAHHRPKARPTQPAPLPRPKP
ncbi:MAG: hypothetical protein H6905_03760 [Hyphomicrobiales bacterium]|nr:hypothetical protein [Hyphomicrobiales bacterium]